MRRVLRTPPLNIGLPLYETYQDRIEEIEILVAEGGDLLTARQVFQRFLPRFGYYAWLQEQGLKTKAGWIEELADRITEFEEKSEDYDFSLQAFLESISLQSAIDRFDERAEAVSLMTLHTAKGLEWPNVWITGCEEGLIPLRSGELEEERRLFFVGLTRARDRLYLSSAKQRQKWGKVIGCKPSRFLDEME